MNEKNFRQQALDEKARQMGVEKISLVMGEVASLKEDIEVFRKQMAEISGGTEKGGALRRIKRLENDLELIQKRQSQYGELNHQIWELLTDLELPFREGENDLRKELSDFKKQIVERNRVPTESVTVGGSRAVWVAIVLSIIALFTSVFFK